MKKCLWQLHSWLGLLCGLGLVVIGLTGSLLVFHEELDAWRFPERFRATPSPAGRLSYDALWTAVQRVLPPGEVITGWLPATAPDRTDGLAVSRLDGPPGNHRHVHLDPYVGALRGAPVDERDTLTGWLTAFHYSFLGGAVGTAVAGLLAFGLLALGVSGVWLYRDFWRSFFTLRWRRSARIFFSDLHKMVGISSVAFNLVLGFTGLWWNGQIVVNAVSTALGGSTPAPSSAQPPAPPVVPFDPARENLSVDALFARAERELPGFRPTYVAFPATREGEITFFGTVPVNYPLRGDYGSRVVFGAPDGATKQVTDIRQASVWAKIGDSFALLHFGTFGGWPVKVLWTLGGLTPGVLAVSGFVIWRARHRSRRRVSHPATPRPAVASAAELA